MTIKSTRTSTTTEAGESARTGQVSRRDVLKGAAALSVGTLGMASLRAPGAAAQDQLAADQTIRLPEGEPVRFDPAVTSGGKGIEQLQNLFEGLVTIDQRYGSLQMGLASK